MGTHTRSARSLLQRRPIDSRRCPGPVCLPNRSSTGHYLRGRCSWSARTIPIPRALERMCGLQDQYAPSGYIGLWTRLAGFERDDLTKALERRAVIQATLMRATIHLVSRRDFWPFASAIDEPLREWWFRATKRGDERRRLRAIDTRGRRLLADGPRRKKEILEALHLPASDFVGVGLWTQLVRMPPSGTWDQRRADLYGLAEQWVGPPSSTVEQGRDLLVRRYLAAFGPAARADIATLHGLAVADARRCASATAAARVPSRRRRASSSTSGAPRCPTAGHGGAGAIPSDLGRDAARPRAPNPDPARTVPLRRSSTPRCRSRSARSSSTGRSQVPGASTVPALRPHPSNRCRGRRCERLTAKPRRSPRCSPNACRSSRTRPRRARLSGSSSAHPGATSGQRDDRPAARSDRRRGSPRLVAIEVHHRADHLAPVAGVDQSRARSPS